MKKILYLLLAICCISNCGSFISNSGKKITVYVGGYQTSNYGKAQAKYWKNGKEVILTDGKISASVDSLYISGKDIYAVVNERVFKASYWKNGKFIYLPVDDEKSLAFSIFVSGSDVYVAGIDGFNKPVYWKNNEKVVLPVSSEYDGSSTNSIYVSGNDVYVAGTDEYQAVYWKNGKAFHLTNGKHMSEAKSIFVVGNDVYIVGRGVGKGEFRIVKYWKNGKEVNITDGSRPARGNSIFVLNNDVYIAGSEENKAIYWKNGKGIYLEGGAEAHSIFVLGNDVYVAGYYDPDYDPGPLYKSTDKNIIAKYWKNGVPVNLTDGTRGAFAHSIFVVEE